MINCISSGQKVTRSGGGGAARSLSRAAPAAATATLRIYFAKKFEAESGNNDNKIMAPNGCRYYTRAEVVVVVVVLNV